MLTALIALAAAGTPALAERVEGTWNGALDIGGASLRLVVHLEPEGTGWTGTMDSPDQGATGIPIDVVAATPAGLILEVHKVGGTYRGTWTEEGLEGTWSQGPTSLPLALTRGAVAAPARPQEPTPPFPYAEHELRFGGGPGVELAGTLTVPAGSGPFPGIALVSGSGPQDRDEALMGHRPFAVLADALTRAGVAVLRYDDRGVGASGGAFAGALTTDFATDAAGAVAALRARPEVDGDRVGILGHSEGGYVASLVAAEQPVAFALLMAGPGLTGKGVLESQVEALAVASGASAAQAKQSRAAQSTILDALASGASEAELRAVLRGAGVPKTRIDAELPALLSPWYRAFVAFDPEPHLRALDVPVLALLGERDVQVVAPENAAALERSLSENPDATVEILPGLNHLLQPAKTGLPSEYGTIEQTIDAAALQRITSWVVAHSG